MSYAKEKYLLGDGVKRGCIIRDNYALNNCAIEISTEHNDKFGIRGGGACLYQNGKWAEIISTPEDKPILTKEETKFEEGKWYKINNAWYAKHECIHGSGRYWRHSDRITIHKTFYDKSGNLGDDWKSAPIVLLEDLSEIQQYLPEGHPDKFKEEPKLVFPFKVGDKIRCVELRSWASELSKNNPVTKCKTEIVEITNIGELNNCLGEPCISFAATYEGIEYGFSYSDDNKYELVEENNFWKNHCEQHLQWIGGYIYIHRGTYAAPKTEAIRNPLDDSERKVNIIFNKPKQIKL